MSIPRPPWPQVKKFFMILCVAWSQHANYMSLAHFVDRKMSESMIARPFGAGPKTSKVG